MGSLLLPRLISYCSKNRLTLLVDGERVGDVEIESETDYEEDYEKDPQTFKRAMEDPGHPWL